MTFTDKVATLIINKVDSTDAGVYRCEADNKVARVETEAEVSVNGKNSLYSLLCIFTNTGFTFQYDVIIVIIIIIFQLLLFWIMTINLRSKQLNLGPCSLLT